MLCKKTKKKPKKKKQKPKKKKTSLKFFLQLRSAPEEHPVLMTVQPLLPKASREKIAQIMFETFNVPAMQLFSDPVCAAVACGRTTALVLVVGETMTYAAPGSSKKKKTELFEEIFLTLFLSSFKCTREWICLMQLCVWISVVAQSQIIS